VKEKKSQTRVTSGRSGKSAPLHHVGGKKKREQISTKKRHFGERTSGYRGHQGKRPREGMCCAPGNFVEEGVNETRKKKQRKKKKQTETERKET